MATATITTTVNGLTSSTSFLTSLIPTSPRATVPKSLSDSAPAPPTSSHLLRLPAELRLQIYTLALALDSNSKTHFPFVLRILIGTLPSPNLLLTSKQIYLEARLLPFQTNSFDFYCYYGSSVHSCRQFLRSLQDWQRCEIRDLRLTVVERDLQGLGIVFAFVDVCEMLGQGLKRLRLDVEGSFEDEEGNCLLDGDAAWVEDGLERLKGLGRLDVVVRDVDLQEERLGKFEVGLKEKLPGCRVGVKKAQKTIEVAVEYVMADSIARS